MLKEKKIALVQKIQDLLSDYQNFALIKIDKTNHQTLENLRKELKKNQAIFKVIKNTLFEKTINKLVTPKEKFVELKNSFLPLKETNALLLLEKEWNEGFSTFSQFARKEKSLSFKFGFLDGKSYASDQLLRIAQLPPKPQLIANIIGSFKSPSSRLVYLMKFNMSKFAYLLNQKSKKSN